ncbi:helix-turn-helix domain-containing protein [Bradyrhizobium sp. CB3481]|uniref:helix-turn-helix domain-containing protein n=1 Tax=Bradyrhizobium sp. CB3481 TaxID=3039158 RepID=UPI0024B052E8|nr:helix-turn-helix domain-containing protein [Bradyrhizobium sp. CB3481]WFU19930.1 helix-turn-helix domain-containing protein [Bradyrhizobium sp. CB3481]
MVKNGQARAMQGLPQQSILGVDYANPKFPELGIESLCLSELLGRVPPSHFASPQRPGFHLLMLFTSGSGDHFLDFRRVRCKAGTLVHARPGQVQQFVLGQALEADVLLFTSEFLFPAIPAPDGAAFGPLIDDIVPEDVTDLQPDALESVVSVMSAIQRAYSKADGSKLSATILQHLLHAVLLTIAIYYLKCDARRMTDSLSMIFQRFRQALEAKFTQTRTVEDYAEAIGCSAKSLRRACMMASDCSPKSLIEQRLILEAKRLLAHTGLTVEAIAAELGFSEPTNFVKFFRRHGGMRPLDFRVKFPGPHSG